MGEWEKAVGVNVWGALHMTRQVLPGMIHLKQGKVILLINKKNQMDIRFKTHSTSINNKNQKFIRV